MGFRRVHRLNLSLHALSIELSMQIAQFRSNLLIFLFNYIRIRLITN